MKAISPSFVISLLLSGFPQLMLAKIYAPVEPIAAQPSRLLQYLPVWLDQLSPLEVINENICEKQPIGVGIPGFEPGIHQSAVLRMFGVPKQIRSGYWPNTKAISYDLIPGQVSLGFLFDLDSEKLRQSEAAFDDFVDTQVIFKTLNGMLGCKLSEEIKQGFQQVRQRKSKSYEFRLDNLSGLIERDQSDRIYIGIWEVDLH